MSKNNRKAQVTVFVIIGIVLLIGALIFLFYRSSSSQQSSEETTATASNVPLEFQPINDFVESCIQKTGKEAIKQLGMHGGYIDLNRYGIQSNAANPTQSRAFLFNNEDTSSGIPYWNYFMSDNKCETGCQCGSEQPYLYKKDGSPSIEKQVEDYLDENLDQCLNDFKAFKNQGFDATISSEVKTTANVRASDVMFVVSYKIKVKKDSSSFDIERFTTIVPVQLKKIYDLAEKIRLNEMNYSYMEKWTVEQLSGFGLGVKSDRIPPIAASELSPGQQPVYWIKQKVKDDITNNILPLYVPFFSVYGTKNYNTAMTGTFYERATLPIEPPANDNYNDLEVRFNYMNWWPIYFDITGRGVSGQKIGPETASSSLLSFIGVKRYNLYYDVSYPILMDIYSEDAFNGEGLHFYVGFENNVRNNKAINCTGPGLTEYAAPTGSLFCNENQGCANITIITKDAKTNDMLDKVSIFYSSGFEGCDKGITQNVGSKSVLETSLPGCVGTGCSLNAVKDDYFSYPVTYAVRCGAAGGICSDENVLCNKESLSIKLEPYRHNKVMVMKKKMIKQSQKTWTFSNSAEKLLNNEYAFISLEKIKDNPSETDFSIAGLYYGNESSIELYPGLIPGNYKINVNLFYKFPDTKNRDNVVFQKVTSCSDTMLGLSESCTNIGPVNFTDSFVEGGFTSEITLTKEMLDNYNNLIFYALSAPDIDTSYNVLDAYDLDEISKYENYSTTYKVELKPIVS